MQVVVLVIVDRADEDAVQFARPIVWWGPLYPFMLGRAMMTMAITLLLQLQLQILARLQPVRQALPQQQQHLLLLLLSFKVPRMILLMLIPIMIERRQRVYREGGEELIVMQAILIPMPQFTIQTMTTMTTMTMTMTPSAYQRYPPMIMSKMITTSIVAVPLARRLSVCPQLIISHLRQTYRPVRRLSPTSISGPQWRRNRGKARIQ